MLDACSMTCAANASPAIKHRIAWLDMHGVKLELKSVFIPFARHVLESFTATYLIRLERRKSVTVQTRYSALSQSRH
jgi:hypothetical protein